MFKHWLWLSLVLLYFGLCSCFLLKSEQKNATKSTTAIPPYRIVAASRNVLNIKAGLPRGVFSLSSPFASSENSTAVDIRFNESNVAKDSKSTVPNNNRNLTMILSFATTTAKSFLSTLITTVTTKIIAQPNNVSAIQNLTVNFTEVEISSSLSAVKELEVSSSTSTLFTTVSFVPSATLTTQEEKLTTRSAVSSSTELSVNSNFTTPIVFSSTFSNVGISSNRTMTPMDIAKINTALLNTSYSTTSSVVTDPVFLTETSTIVTSPRRNESTQSTAASNTVLTTKPFIISTNITKPAVEVRKITPERVSIPPTVPVTTSMQITSSSSATFSTTASKATMSTTTSSASLIFSTFSVTIEKCERNVSGLTCRAPDFDKNEIYGHCSWDSYSADISNYGISVKEANDARTKSQTTNFTSYDFAVKPGKFYEVSVYWLVSKDEPIDLIDCKFSTSLLSIPFERPKLQADADWLTVNTTSMMVSIHNPFYQSQSSGVARLSLDLDFAQSNSSIICEPSSWYNVPLAELISCEIMNLNNVSIDELIFTLNASGDPAGKDAGASSSARRTVTFGIKVTPKSVSPTNSPPSSSPVVDNAAAAGGGAAAGVVVGAILVVTLVILVRRYRRNSPKQTWQANVSMPPGLALVDDAFNQNFSDSSFAPGPVAAEKFEAYVASLERNSGLGYASLWEDVRLVGLQHSTVAAELAVNRPKNRFTNVLPYDHSRVKLLPWPAHANHKGGDADDDSQYTNKPSDGNDYINANFVPGLLSDHEYIATQGPLPTTIPDFWRLVWQHRVCAIIMLTKMKEGGNRKCECYWPPNVDIDAGEFPFGPLNVQLVSQSDELASPVPGFNPPDSSRESAGVWTIRDFRMTLSNDDGSQTIQTRNLRQYQFMDWPDQGVPSGRNRNHLLRFVRLVRSQVDRASGKIVEPILVHCSAGVGRSGAFVAMDILLQELAAGRSLDVTGVVRRLRDYRQLVQTEQQFRFIHELMVDAINGNVIEGKAVDADHPIDQTHRSISLGSAHMNRTNGRSNTAFVDDLDDGSRFNEADDKL